MGGIMELKNKWEKLYDFSQDEERYDELCAEQCYGSTDRQIEIAKELSRLNNKLAFKLTIEKAFEALEVLEELKDEDKDFEEEYNLLFKDLENKRFKLPRSKWNFVGSRGNVGDYVDAKGHEYTATATTSATPCSSGMKTLQRN